MRKSRFTTEQIIGFIKQVEAGMAVTELGRQHGFSPASFYAWRAKYAGMEGRVAISRLVARFPGLALSGPVRWNGRMMNLRGALEIPVSV